jgi:hypothetical protein
MKLLKLSVNPEDIARQHGEKRKDKVTAAREFSRKECRPKSKSMSDLLRSCFVIAMLVCTGAAQAEDDASAVARKLVNPLSDAWSMYTEFDFNTNNGSLHHGNLDGYSMLFEPAMPIPLTDDWRVIVRPVVPVVFSTAIPEAGLTGLDFDYRNGLGDISLSLLFTPMKTTKKLMIAAGPNFLFPTATTDSLGTNTWEMGPAVALVYANPKITIGALSQYFWSVATTNDAALNTSHGDILYFGFYNLPNAWQIGFTPTITYNARATSGNKWNVPVGPVIAKTIKIGKTHVQFQLGIEKSIVSEDDFGKDWQVKFVMIPVIPSLIKRPLFSKR